MDHKYKALMQNIPLRHIIYPIAAPPDRTQQIAQLRNLDINNFLILGSSTSIRDVLGKYRLFLCWLLINWFLNVLINYFFFPQSTSITFFSVFNIHSEAANEEYFDRNFAWYGITQHTGRFTCDCENVTLIFLQPSPDLAAKDRLRLMVHEIPFFHRCTFSSCSILFL